MLSLLLPVQTSFVARLSYPSLTLKFVKRLSVRSVECDATVSMPSHAACAIASSGTEVSLLPGDAGTQKLQLKGSQLASHETSIADSRCIIWRRRGPYHTLILQTASTSHYLTRIRILLPARCAKKHSTSTCTIEFNQPCEDDC
jgi:hypothetical protein